LAPLKAREILRIEGLPRHEWRLGIRSVARDIHGACALAPLPSVAPGDRRISSCRRTVAGAVGSPRNRIVNPSEPAFERTTAALSLLQPRPSTGLSERNPGASVGIRTRDLRFTKPTFYSDGHWLLPKCCQKISFFGEKDVNFEKWELPSTKSGQSQDLAGGTS
jgi:hypothetical protein